MNPVRPEGGLWSIHRHLNGSSEGGMIECVSKYITPLGIIQCSSATLNSKVVSGNRK